MLGPWSQATAVVVTLLMTLMVAAGAAGGVRATYAVRAGALCEQGIRQMKVVPKPTSATSFRAYLKTEVRLGEALLRRLQALKPPAALKPRVDRALDWQWRFERRAGQLISELEKSSDPAGTVQRAEPSLKALAYQAGAAWRRAGLSKCAA